MRILVTGYKGVIGSYLWRMLNEYERHGIDLKDGTDLGTVNIQSLMEHIQPEIVFHLAASFERTQETPEAFNHIFHNDTLASHRLLETIKDCMSVKTVIFASSYLIYDLQTNPLTLSEMGAINPRNLCGMSKLHTERELEFLCKSTRPDIRYVNARIFRVYGEGGKEIISRWCRAKIRGERTVVFNEENRFDFIHAQDVAESLKRLAFTKEAHGVINLGTGRSRSIKEVCELIGLKPERIKDDPETESSCADITKLKNLTGWSPSIELGEGIEGIIEAESNDYLREPKSGSCEGV